MGYFCQSKTLNFTVQHSMTNTDIRVKTHYMGEVKKKCPYKKKKRNKKGQIKLKVQKNN